MTTHDIHLAQFQAIKQALDLGRIERVEKLLQGIASVDGKRVARADLIDPYARFAVEGDARTGKLVLQAQSVVSLLLSSAARGEGFAKLLQLPELDLDAAIERHGGVPLVSQVLGADRALDLFELTLHPIVLSNFTHSAFVSGALGLVRAASWSRDDIRIALFGAALASVKQRALSNGDSLCLVRSVVRALNQVLTAAADGAPSVAAQSIEGALLFQPIEAVDLRSTLLHTVCASDMNMFSPAETNHATEVVTRLVDRAERVASIDVIDFVNSSEGLTGNRPLHRAALAHNVSLVRELLRRGADPLAPNASGRNAREECQALPESIATLLSAAEARALARRAVADFEAPSRSMAHAP